MGQNDPFRLLMSEKYIDLLKVNYGQYAQSVWPHDLTKVKDIYSGLGESPSRRRQGESGGLAPRRQQMFTVFT